MADKQKKKLNIFNIIMFALAVIAFAMLVIEFLSLKDSINNSSQRKNTKEREVLIKAKTGEVISQNARTNFDDIKTEEEEIAPKVQEIIPVEEEKDKGRFTNYTEADYANGNLCIILTEAGGRQDILDLAYEILPKETAFAFTPYADDLRNKMKTAKAKGKKTLLNLMFEPSNFPTTDTGPLTILSYMDESQKAIKLQDTISKSREFKGVMTNSDEILTHNYENVLPILKILRNRELFFAFTRKPVNAYLENDVKPLALDVVTIDYIIDLNMNEADIIKKLDDIKFDIVENKQKIVVAFRAFPLSINTVSKWLEKNLSEPGVQIAPIDKFITDN